MTMDKDFTKENSDLDEVPDEDEKDPEDPELSAITDIMIMNARKQSLEEKIRSLEREREELHIYMQTRELTEIMNARNQSLVETFQSLEREREKLHIYMQTREYSEGISRLSPLVCLVSPIVSPAHETQNLPEDAFENLLDSRILSECSEQTSSKPVEALEEQSNDIPSELQNVEDSTQFESLNNSRKKSSDNEIQASGSHTELDDPSDLGTIDNEESVKYVGKGKEAANPAFRYKKGSKDVSFRDSHGKVDNPISSHEKGSKANVSSSTSLAKDSPLKGSDKAFCSPVSKSNDSQPPKAGLTRISPAIKRKGSYSNENDFDESCVKTLETSKSHGNCTNDDLNIVKKLKFEDDEKVSSRYPTLTELLSQKKHKSIDLAEFMEQPQTDQTSYNREQLNLPSTSGISNVVGSTSNSEESSLGSGSEDVFFNERDGSSLASGSKDILHSKREESFLSSGSEDSMFGEKEESSFTDCK